jgi:hypothetical protein
MAARQQLLSLNKLAMKFKAVPTIQAPQSQSLLQRMNLNQVLCQLMQPHRRVCQSRSQKLLELKTLLETWGFQNKVDRQLQQSTTGNDNVTVMLFFKLTIMGCLLACGSV